MSFKSFSISASISIMAVLRGVLNSWEIVDVKL